jgi:hypothetical protein
MCHERHAGAAERHPQVLSAAAHAGDLLSDEVILQGALVPAHRPRMEHLYIGDDPARDPSIETAPHDLDLR